MALASNQGTEGALVVSHGIVPSLYFAKPLGMSGRVYNRWRSLRFCAWGTTRGNIVIRDLG